MAAAEPLTAGDARIGHGSSADPTLPSPELRRKRHKQPAVAHEPGEEQLVAHSAGSSSSSSGQPAAQLPPMVRQGDAVYVVGHGPGILEEVSTSSSGRGKKRYRVRYPNGSSYHVGREQILLNEDVAALPKMRASSCTRSRPIGEALVLERGAGPRGLVYLGRAFDDSDRNASTSSAIFSLVSTMVGGGVLSLPYAMSQCGLVMGSIVLFGAAATSTWTMDMLIACARRTGRDTFELVGHAALGEFSRKFTIALVGVTTLLALIAYTVLLGDLVVPLVQLAVPPWRDVEDPTLLRNAVLLSSTLILAPMCFKNGMHSVRFLCYASAASVATMSAIIVYQAVKHLGEQHTVWTLSDGRAISQSIMSQYELWPSGLSQALYGVPIFGISFACHFNAFSTHTELQRPTRPRMRRVLVLTMSMTAFLYLIIGVAGYIYACQATCGNILLNFAPRDPLAIVGRSLLAVVLILNMPLVVQPCRNSLFRLISGSRCCSLSTVSSTPGACLAPETGTSLADQQRDANPEEPGAERKPEATQDGPCSPRVHVYLREDVSGRASQMPASPSVFDSYLPKSQTVQDSASTPTNMQRYALTVVVLCTSLGVSCFLQNVLVVWSIMGSTAAFLIAFILPAAYWYQIVGPSASACRRRSVLLLLGLAAALAICCTVETIMKLGNPPCPTLSAASQ